MVRRQRKGQLGNDPEINREKFRETISLRNLVISPLSTKLIEWPPTDPPSKAYPIGAPIPSSAKADIYVLTKSSEECDPPADGYTR